MTLERAGDVDLTTGAFTRPRFEQELLAAVPRARRAKQSLSLLYLDVDDFSELADLVGREETDALLATVAARLSATLDGRGPIGRVGEDELAVILPGVGITEATRLAELVRRAAEQGPPAVRVTVSVGVVTLRRGEPPLNLLEAAEDACLHAKQAGRNTVAGR